jgi:tRNA modification GTPase
VEQFTARGCITGEPIPAGSVLDRLAHAPTLRTASILVDQLHGAFERAVTRILNLLATNPDAAREPLSELARYAPIGRHLVEPWMVVVAGAPNVGKSSLVNALAGFQRAVVSDIAGTTRDLVSVQVAFEGWPVELTDTAGLREAEGLEAAGVERANRALAEADLVLWVADRSDPHPRWPAGSDRAGQAPLFIANKADLPSQWSGEERDALAVSAATGAGLGELVGVLVSRLVPESPRRGVAVPYSSALVDRIEAAQAELAAEAVDKCDRLLRDCLHRPG